jgi:hypothetical protein
MDAGTWKYFSMFSGNGLEMGMENEGLERCRENLVAKKIRKKKEKIRMRKRYSCGFFRDQ